MPPHGHLQPSYPSTGEYTTECSAIEVPRKRLRHARQPRQVKAPRGEGASRSTPQGGCCALSQQPAPASITVNFRASAVRETGQPLVDNLGLSMITSMVMESPVPCQLRLCDRSCTCRKCARMSAVAGLVGRSHAPGVLMRAWHKYGEA